MTKKIFHKDTRSMSVTVQGKYPTHSVVGTPSDFYVYLSDKGANSWSEWIKGDPRLYRDLSELHREPHAWVLEAMEKAYTQGLEDCCKIHKGERE